VRVEPTAAEVEVQDTIECIMRMRGKAKNLWVRAVGWYESG
jgi:hypothetical protein